MNIHLCSNEFCIVLYCNVCNVCRPILSPRTIYRNCIRFIYHTRHSDRLHSCFWIVGVYLHCCGIVACLCRLILNSDILCHIGTYRYWHFLHDAESFTQERHLADSHLCLSTIPDGESLRYGFRYRTLRHYKRRVCGNLRTLYLHRSPRAC